MPKEKWTFESLCQADKPTLEQVLRGSKPPNQEAINGYGYDGYNHDWLGQIPGKKFRKAFWRLDHHPYGFNQIVNGDRQAYTGKWQVRTAGDKPAQRGFFSILAVQDDPPIPHLRQYHHLKYFDYNVPQNSGFNIVMRPICDYVGLPNEGDHELDSRQSLPADFPLSAYFCDVFHSRTPRKAGLQTLVTAIEPPIGKAELLRRLDQGKADFDAVLARLNADQGDRLMVTEAWTVKDLIAHLIAHEQRAVEELRAAVRGQRPDVPLGDNDAFNLGAVMACRTMSYEAIKAAWDRSFAEVVEMVQRLADADFEPSSRLEGLARRYG